jgi:hypothetical protein
MNAGLLVVSIAFSCSVIGTVALYLKQQTLGALVKTAPGVHHVATPYYIASVFLLTIVNSILFACDVDFFESWARWPYIGLQTTYALTWVGYLFLEYHKIFKWTFLSTKVIITFNFYIQLCAIIVIAVAYTTEHTGIFYLVVQIVITLHTTLYDYAMYITLLAPTQRY